MASSDEGSQEGSDELDHYTLGMFVLNRAGMNKEQLSQAIEESLAESYPQLDKPCVVTWVSFYSKWNRETERYEDQPHANVILSNTAVTEDLIEDGGMIVEFNDVEIELELDGITPFTAGPGCEKTKLYFTGFDRTADPSDVVDELAEHLYSIADVKHIVVPKNYAKVAALIVLFHDEISAGLVLRLAKLTELPSEPNRKIKADWAKARPAQMKKSSKPRKPKRRKPKRSDKGWN